ncbi:uncharacterized protein LOC8273121 [Ricinus communis]|uniref:Phosphoglycerate mutase, putative n=1 Tax=Ricinus communis TaxID=3988 RepID=B9RGZ7_RICCO|nr:uncharacterized protein LOC8273121 [Ricinus communis]EEF49359.1 phosphoglycerate mutase, putative [Ricinus communis]|eukprot:XP_002512856.1 uncharacterized protein LOC8273121 [Ricinus communis]
MGSTQSVQVPDEEEEEEEEEEEDDIGEGNSRDIDDANNLIKKVLEQEPEMLPCHASASPLSPQPSSLGTPRLGPSIKVWDPYNVLAPPPPPPPPVFSRSFSSSSRDGIAADEDRAVTVTEVFLISHGECELNLRPDLIGGRCHVAALTTNGKRQARALAVFLNSHGVRFNAVYCSPLDRARSMAVSVCQAMNFAEGQIQSSDALVEMSLGHWEGCPGSEIYTPEVLSLIENFQPDFCAPSGESLRQVEFRMVQFLNGTVLRLPAKLRSDFSLHHQNESQVFSHDRDPPGLLPQHWDMHHRHRPVFSRKKSGKSRLQFVSTTGNHDGEDEISPREDNHQNPLHNLNIRSSSSSISSCIGVFTHSIPIKCVLTGLLGCSPVMSHKICIEDSSVTVLQHSWKTGWQIKRLNDTAHLRLL